MDLQVSLTWLLVLSATLLSEPGNVRNIFLCFQGNVRERISYKYKLACWEVVAKSFLEYWWQRVS